MAPLTWLLGLLAAGLLGIVIYVILWFRSLGRAMRGGKR